MSKKLTLKELLDHKEKIKNKKVDTATLYIKSIDAEITIKAPSSALIVEAQGEGEKDGTRADAYIAYQCITEPNLKDAELQKEYGCVEPLDIVEMIFLPGEVAAIASEIMQLAGFGSNVSKVGKEIKN